MEQACGINEPSSWRMPIATSPHVNAFDKLHIHMLMFHSL